MSSSKEFVPFLLLLSLSHHRFRIQPSRVGRARATYEMVRLEAGSMDVQLAWSETLRVDWLTRWVQQKHAMASPLHLVLPINICSAQLCAVLRPTFRMSKAVRRNVTQAVRSAAKMSKAVDAMWLKQ